MYEELVKALRDDNACLSIKTAHEAADAIENISKAYQMMAEAYEAEVTKQDWISVTERLPKIGETVIVAIKSKMHKGAYIVQTSFLCYDNTFTLDDVDMWMPLPEPPKEET